jgi:hypothetical protein
MDRLVKRKPIRYVHEAKRTNSLSREQEVLTNLVWVHKKGDGP